MVGVDKTFVLVCATNNRKICMLCSVFTYFPITTANSVADLGFKGQDRHLGGEHSPSWRWCCVKQKSNKDSVSDSSGALYFVEENNYLYEIWAL